MSTQIPKQTIFPTLYSYDSKGRVKQWRIGVQAQEDGTAIIMTEAGLRDGKKKKTPKAIKKGKNIGKANETSPLQQAISDAKSKHNKKVDAGYVQDISMWVRHNYPMKAQTFEDPEGKKSAKHHIKYPAHAGAKLNGLCVIGEEHEGKAALRSKTLVLDYMKACGHLRQELEYYLQILNDTPLHGELYKHGWTLEEINRCAKKYRPGKSEQLELHVYDLVDPNMKCKDRDDLLDRVINIENHSGMKIIRHPYVVVNNETELREWHDKWVKMGYEGACVRNIDEPYEIGVKSKHLQKCKFGWQDAEFTILGGKAELQYSGEDNEIEHECVVFKCQDPENPDVIFDCRPKGSIQLREQMMKDLPQLIGQDLKVKFFSRMESGAPEFPVGLEIRGYE